MQRISGTLLWLGFAAVALLWPWVHSLSEPKPAPTVVAPVDPAPTPSQEEKVIAFCLDSRHANSLLCSDQNPRIPANPAGVVREFKTRSAASRPIVVESKNTKTTIERPRTTAKSPVPEPSTSTQRALRVPVPVDLPVNVPDVDVPVVDTKVSVDDSDKSSASEEEKPKEENKEVKEEVDNLVSSVLK
jgi:hypothetical protein